MSALRNWSGLRWLAAAGATILTTLAIGIPTDLIDTPLFSRMTPARWWDYPLWLVVAALGFSGALTFFEPIQPLLGLASVAILVHALRFRIRAERSCSPMTVPP
jgi:hypothetical protein